MVRLEPKYTLTFAVAFVFTVVTEVAAVPRPVKLLLHGWEFSGVTPAEIFGHADQFDRLPSSGVTVYARRDLPDGTRLNPDQIMGDGNWTRENVSPFIPVLKEFSRHRGLKESMLAIRCTTTNHLDWTDDAAWAIAGDNLAVLAWLAKKGGLKGIVIDCEEYNRKLQFTHRYFRNQDPPYPVVCELARRRAREIFGKVFAVYPDITILFYQFLTQHPRYQDYRDPRWKVRDWSDLFPSFCNGVLDVLPPTAKIVDGCENSGYGCCTIKEDRSRFGDFFKQAAYQMGGALGLVSHENHRRYRSQVGVSFGMWLDGFLNRTNENGMYYHGPLDGSRLKHFAKDFEQACQAADEYVWLWGEQGRWIDWRNVKWEHANLRTPWEVQSPGLCAEIARIVAADLTGTVVQTNGDGVAEISKKVLRRNGSRSGIRSGPVKCLLHGWEFAVTGVTPERILAHADQFDRLPSSGIALYLNRVLADGSKLTDDTVLCSPLWTYENLSPFIPALKEFPKHRGLRESMISFRCTTTNRIDWADDEAWSRAGDNIATIARVAKECGLKGLVVDCEEYNGKRFWQFTHYHIRNGKVWPYDDRKADLPYEEAKALVRRRGREVFQKVFAVYPDITLLFYQFSSYYSPFQRYRDPEVPMREESAMLPAFFDGILDALPSTAKIVDGGENSGYGCCTVKKDVSRFGDFFRQAAFQTGGALGLISPENHKKYREQLSVSFGMWLDGCLNRTNETGMYYHGPLDGSRLKHFAKDFAQACQAADEYVWLWGEQGRWIDWKQDGDLTFASWRAPWETQAPGILRAISHVLRPERALLDARDDLVASKCYANLVEDKSFRRTFKGVAESEFEISVRGVRPGGRYGVLALRRGEGEEPGPRVLWRQHGKTLSGDVAMARSFPDETGACWRMCEARAPDGADEMRIRFNIRQAPYESYELIDLQVFRLDPGASICISVGEKQGTKK